MELNLQEKTPKPISLYNICAKLIANNIDIIVIKNESSRQFIPRPNICLPPIMSQSIFDRATDYNDPKFIAAFASENLETRNPFPVTNLHFPSTFIDAETFGSYLRRNVDSMRSIVIHVDCSSQLGYRTIQHINTYGRNVTDLRIQWSMSPPQGQELQRPLITLHGPLQLRKFVLHNHRIFTTSPELFYWSMLNRYTNTLLHLDLSGCDLGVQFGKIIPHLVQLKTLILHRASLPDTLFNDIHLFPKTIKYLDISQPYTNTNEANFAPSHFLCKIVSNLPNLDYLDLSWIIIIEIAQLENSSLMNISHRSLKYLGLYKTGVDTQNIGCHSQVIGSDRNVEELLNAARNFIHREYPLLNILRHLGLCIHEFIGGGNNAGIRLDFTSEQIHAVLNIALLSMEHHLESYSIQIECITIINAILKQFKDEQFVLNMTSEIIIAICNSLSIHPETLYLNDVRDIFYELFPHELELATFKKLIKTLLTIVSGQVNHPSYERITRLGLYYLNIIVRYTTTERKNLAGRLGLVEKVLSVINNLLVQYELEQTDVIQVAWQLLWNSTPMVPENSERFLNHKGLEIFTLCLLWVFHLGEDQNNDNAQKRDDIIWNMVGTLSNVSTVHDLRPQMINNHLIKDLVDLLEFTTHNLCFTVAEILANLLAHEPESWARKGQEYIPLRQEVCQILSEKLRYCWPTDEDRNVRYTTFQKIIHLVNIQHTTECRLLGFWILANLTTLRTLGSAEYVTLFTKENGMEFTRPLLSSQDPHLKHFAEIVYEKVMLWSSPN